MGDEPSGSTIYQCDAVIFSGPSLAVLIDLAAFSQHGTGKVHNEDAVLLDGHVFQGRVRELGLVDAASQPRYFAVSDGVFSGTLPRTASLCLLVDDGTFGYGDGLKIRLNFRIDKAAGLHVVECPLSADPVVKEVDDAYEITATVVE
jgi:hypothetical protein